MHSGEQAATRWIAAASRVTVLTGAGLSTDSGIPDFRGPQGLWTKDPAASRMSELSAYVGDRGVRIRAWRSRRDHPAWSARPNAGHRALVALERSGRLRAVVTQNVDGLQQSAGSDPSRVVEVHGTIWRVECLSCERQLPMRDVLRRVDAGEEDPHCERCGGLLKSATISFGQALRPDALRAAVDAARDCEVFLTAGTSLSVHPAAGLCDVAISAGARLVVLNGEPTPYDGRADAVVRGRLGEVLPRLVGDAAA